MLEPHASLSFLLLLGAIIAAAKTGAWLSLRLRQPAVLGELLAGVFLGPTVLDVLHRAPFASEPLAAGVFLFAAVGVILLMFVAGLDTDLDHMRMVGRAAVSAGVAGVLAPVILGLLAGLSFGFAWPTSLFVGIVLGATSVSITVQTLIELGRLRSKEGVTLLAAAVVDDVVALLVLSIFVALSHTGTGSAWGAVAIVLRIMVFMTAAAGTGPLLRKVLGVVQRAPISEGLLSAIVVAILVYAWAAEALGGIASITGAYLAGILVARAGLREVSERQLKGILYALLVPVFFVSIGLQTNARSLHLGDVPFAAVIIVAAVVGKVVGCGLAVRRAGFSRPEALRVGVGMVSRGEVGLIVAAIGLQAGLLSDRGFAVMVIMVLATTIVTPPLLRLAFGATPRP